MLGPAGRLFGASGTRRWVGLARRSVRFARRRRAELSMEQAQREAGRGRGDGVRRESQRLVGAGHRGGQVDHPDQRREQRPPATKARAPAAMAGGTIGTATRFAAGAIRASRPKVRRAIGSVAA